ncbi:MAG: dependent oxidoreductase [Gemmatimonadetes bacterium]|nr:dependent oxidoreductase [Gemmatimonadota bacterium]
MQRTAVTSSRRSALFDALGAAPFDVLVIGGGITGAGTARDAAMRGLRVALVEQSDFASGTSSRSSRLVHGGVRYLEHGQVGLVFESSRERRTLLRIAPHLVRPLPFTWPVYRGARIGRWKLAAGLTLYDALALFRNVGRHQRLNARGVTSYEPHVSQQRLVGGARYWDSATDDARLTLANVLSAQRAGAVVANHTRVIGMLREGNRIGGASVVDVETGAMVEVRARAVVNATGPWSDKVERLVRSGAASALRGSKGVHVSVPRSRIGNTAALTLTAPQDGRVMFVLPSGAFTIIGTTDTFDDVPPEDVRANERDVAYLLESANHYFPDAALTRSDVVSAWAGLRPLALAAGGGSSASAASREHAISEVEPGLVRVTGGKLTTYRSMASQVVDAVQRSLGGAPTKSLTAHEPLVGGDVADIAREIGDATRVIEDGVVAERLVHAYGSAWRNVWALVGNDDMLRTRIAPERPYLLAELRHAVEHELARTFGDLLIRRTPVAFETQDHGRNAARRIAPSVALWLGWDSAATEAALGAYDLEVTRMFTIDGA